MRRLLLVSPRAHQSLRRIPNPRSPGRRRPRGICHVTRVDLPSRARRMRRRRGCDDSAVGCRSSRPLARGAALGRNGRRDRGRRHRVLHHRGRIASHCRWTGRCDRHRHRASCNGVGPRRNRDCGRQRTRPCQAAARAHRRRGIRRRDRGQRRPNCPGCGDRRGAPRRKGAARRPARRASRDRPHANDPARDRHPHYRGPRLRCRHPRGSRPARGKRCRSRHGGTDGSRSMHLSRKACVRLRSGGLPARSSSIRVRDERRLRPDGRPRTGCSRPLRGWRRLRSPRS